MTPPGAMADTTPFLDAPLLPWTEQQVVDEIARRLDAGIPTRVAVINVAKLVRMRDDPALRDAVLAADLAPVDGVGVMWGARLLGRAVPERVAGIDLFHRLIALAARRGEAVFLLGAREPVVREAVERLLRVHPTLIVAGWHHGYWGADGASVRAAIRDSGASMLFVALGTPAKEIWIHRHFDELGVKLAMGVGGTFDVVARRQRRAPRWLQRAGLEWAYRTVQEPGRLGPRYLETNLRYAGLLGRALVGRVTPRARR